MQGFRIILIILAYNRPDELSKCLTSLGRLLFLPELRPDLRIHIDGVVSPEDLRSVNDCRQQAEQFVWPHGGKSVLVREGNVGIRGQWIGAWDPLNDKEFALIIEDDVEISPLSLVYLAKIIQAQKDDPELFGVALQQAQWQLGICERGRWRRLDLVQPGSHPPLFKYPAVGTWGQLLFPQPWKSFIRQHLAYQDAAVEGLVTEEWERRRRRLFSPIFTRWSLANGMYNLYANFGNNTALACSRQPSGVNSHGTGKNLCRHANEHDLAIFIQKIPAMVPERMSTCFDQLDMDHESIYGMRFFLSESLDAIQQEAAKCCLAQYRIYPNIVGDSTRTVTYEASEGCWLSDPLHVLKSVHANTVLVGFNGKPILTIHIGNISGTLKTLLVDETVYDWRIQNRLPNGGCVKIYCPIRTGLYPAMLS